jgi:hypothetical protein
MESGDWIGLVALLVALASFVVNAYFTRHERRAWIAEVELLRRQVEGEATDRDERRRAQLAAEQGSTSGGDPTDQFTFHVTNLGPSVVRDVDVEVRTIEHEDATPAFRSRTPCSSASRGRSAWKPLGPSRDDATSSSGPAGVTS